MSKQMMSLEVEIDDEQEFLKLTDQVSYHLQEAAAANQKMVRLIHLKKQNKGENNHGNK